MYLSMSSLAKISLLSKFRRISHLAFSSFTKEKNLHTSRIHNEALQKQNTQTSGMPLSLSLSLSLYTRMCACATCVFVCICFLIESFGFWEQVQKMEKSIYAILAIDRWESLNHMEYRLASLTPVHGRLALKFLNWVIKQPGLELNHLTHVFCITTHVLVRARMLRHISQMGIGPNFVFDVFPSLQF
jgi:hypothetical protein